MVKIMLAIELINRVYSEEKIPAIIKYENKIYYYKKDYRDYYCNETLEYLFEKYNFASSNTLDDEIEVLSEDIKRLHGNDAKFNVLDDKSELVITLDENDLGIDELHFEDCYIYKNQDGKWYVRKIQFVEIEKLTEEKFEKLEHIPLSFDLNKSDIETSEYLRCTINAMVDVINVLGKTTFELIDEVNKLKESESNEKSNNDN